MRVDDVAGNICRAIPLENQWPSIPSTALNLVNSSCTML
jgi:hypothetical protein